MTFGATWAVFHYLLCVQEAVVWFELRNQTHFNWMTPDWHTVQRGSRGQETFTASSTTGYTDEMKYYSGSGGKRKRKKKQKM